MLRTAIFRTERQENVSIYLRRCVMGCDGPHSATLQIQDTVSLHYGKHITCQLWRQPAPGVITNLLSWPDVMDVSNKCKCIFILKKIIFMFSSPVFFIFLCDGKSKIHSDVSPGLIYISRYFILQFDRIFFNLIYTPSINWSRILGSEGVSAVVGEELGSEDEFRIQQFEMDFRITFHDVSFNALSIIYQKCISSIIFGLYCALSEWGA